MPVRIAFVFGLGSLVLGGCGSSATRDVVEVAAAAALELGAAALQAAADDAAARDAAKQARARASHGTPTGNWRLVRQQDDDAECDDTSDDEKCPADYDASASDDESSDYESAETDEGGLTLGKCMVCQ